MPGRDELESLHTALIDARRGYETAAADAETPELKALFGRMLDLHGRAHGEVHRLLAGSGAAPDESGSVMSVVHEAVIDLRSVVGALDEGSLSSFASGEESTLAKYDDALRALAGAPGTEALAKAREELRGMVAEMEGRAGD